MLSSRAFLRVAPGVIALHVADDTLLHPQPGTSAVDHLPGAFAQLAMVAALAVRATAPR